MERTETNCGWKYKLESLKPISDFVLNKADLGKSSPLLLLEDGTPLKGHAAPGDFEKNCRGGYRHAGFVVLFSPTGNSPDAVADHDYTIALSHDVPLPRGDDGRPMYWVYPGTTLKFEFDKPWNSDWGDLAVNLGGRTSGAAAAPLTLTIASEAPVTFEGEAVLHKVEPDFPEGPWSITLSSPADGPFVLLNRLTVGNETAALVVTSERAWRESKKP
jgi:hypothetical protein